ncbi:MAG: NAD-dependent epimerase/dehydratase family protein [Steroidobacteraceae bacterium]
MKRVLITGYNGFTGHHMATRLRQPDAEVFGLVNGSTAGPAEFHGDLTDIDETRRIVAAVRPTHVIHLAAISYIPHGDAKAFYDVNVFGTLNILEALKHLGHTPQRVLIVSSAQVYGTPAIETIDEAVCPRPVNHYGNSKLAMENMTRTWMDRFPIVIARPFNYIGPGQDETRFLIPKIIGHLKRRAPILELGNLNVARDFSDVLDVVEAYARLLDSPAAVGQTVNVCSGTAQPLRSVLALAFEIAGFAPEIRVNQTLVRSNELPKLTGSCALLEALTGFKPSIPIADTLRRMLAT